jgi:hypothetical protein
VKWQQHQAGKGAMGNNRGNSDTPEKSGQSKRDARLAAELRANLRKRKAQARARRQSAPDTPKGSGENG